nr:hypothetical protein [Tanacetum cinerariifolium]
MNEAVRVAVQIQTDWLRDPYQRENDEFLRTINDNMKRIIKEQVKADLSEMELKKILVEKMEGNKSIQRSNEQRNLYKALVEAYEADKIILDTYGETVTLKRRCDDESDKDEGPSAGSDRGSKRQREGKEPELASTPLQTATKSVGRSTTGFKSRQASASESAFAEEPVQTTSQIEEPSHQLKKPPTPDRDWNKTLPAVQGSTQTWISDLQKQADSRSSINELLDTPLDFSNFIMNRLRVDTLKLTNLKIEERFAFNVSLRMFTKIIVIQQRVEDLQLGVESYQKNLNLTKLDTYRSDLKCKEAYTAYSNSRGFIY